MKAQKNENKGGSQKTVMFAVAVGLIAATLLLGRWSASCLPVLEKSASVNQHGFLNQKEIIERASHSGSTVIPPGYTVLDIGASKGGSMGFLVGALNSSGFPVKVPPRTLGLDIDPSKVATCRRTGHDCIEGNALRLSPEGNTVGGITMWHVLEHMPNCQLAKDVWRKTSSAAEHFSSFRGPAFDRADALKTAGFHRYYENWRGHTCHFNSEMLSDAIETSDRRASAYIIALMKPIHSSESGVVLPDGARQDSQRYDPSRHPPKDSSVSFDGPMFEEMRACAVYEDVQSLSYDTAMALRDVFRYMDARQGSVIRCQFPGASTLNDCERRVREQLREFGKRHFVNLV